MVREGCRTPRRWRAVHGPSARRIASWRLPKNLEVEPLALRAECPSELASQREAFHLVQGIEMRTNAGRGQRHVD